MDVPKTIFRKYDIRGEYPKELSEDVAWAIGKAYGTMLRRKNLKSLVLGRDDRKSSVFLVDSFAKGVLGAGCNVTYVGIVPQPVVHFLTFDDAYDSGATVTASHNPDKYNGFKLDYSNAMPVHGEDLQTLYKMVVSEDFEEGKGGFEEKDLKQNYINHTSGNFKFSSDTKVVVNCGNGATSEVAPEVLYKTGVNLAPLYCSYDSSFPHHLPNPEDPIFMSDVVEKVRSFKADIGFGFDGDGDRLGVVDELGKIHSIDRVAVLLIRDVLSKKKGARIIYDVKCSQVLESEISNSGGIPEMIPTGRSTFLEKIMNKEALFGVEYSGHTFFRDEHLGYDDAIYTACRVIRIMESSGKSFSELMAGVPEMYGTPELKIDCSDDEKFEVISRVVSKVDEKVSAGENWKVTKVDGVRVNYSDSGWFLIRASNTNPYLSVRVEGVSESELSLGIGIVAELIEPYRLPTYS